VNHRFDGATIVDEVAGLQLVQGFGQFARFLFVGGELAFQFSAGMLALAQKPQGAAFE
jgi:hypothetical protein